MLTQAIQDGVSIESVRDHWNDIGIFLETTLGLLCKFSPLFFVVNMENGEFFTSNQEATMDLVSKMSPLSEAKTSENVPKNPVIYMLTRGCV